MRLYKTLPEAIAILCSHAASSGSSAVDAHVDDYQWLKTDLQKPARDDYYLPLYELMREDHQPIIEPCLIHLGVTFASQHIERNRPESNCPSFLTPALGARSRAKKTKKVRTSTHPPHKHTPHHTHTLTLAYPPPTQSPSAAFVISFSEDCQSQGASTR